MKIGIAGCGGIGSNVAMNLVRSGIDKFLLVDFDTIDNSNLNRQFFFNEQIGQYKSIALKNNLYKINPKLDIEYKVKKINSNNIYNIFKECDIIIEGFDNKEYKKLLIESFQNKYIISANGIAGRDLTNIKTINFNKVFIIGDFESDVSKFKTYSTKVIYIACIMANKTLDILGGFKNEKF